MSVTVGVPGPADAAALAALMADTFTETYAPDNDPDQIAAHVASAFDPATVAERLADPRRSTLWLLDAGAPVGYLVLNTGAAQTVGGLADGLEVEQVYVRSSHHGQGLGALLLDRAVQTARELGLGFVWLGVWEHNPRAMAFYRKFGFADVGSIDFFVGPDRQTDRVFAMALADEQRRVAG
jgi:GNAT superfamily N-acetyltransferase